MMDNGAVPYMILGQLAWFVRTQGAGAEGQRGRRSGVPHGPRHQDISWRSADCWNGWSWSSAVVGSVQVLCS